MHANYIREIDLTSEIFMAHFKNFATRIGNGCAKTRRSLVTLKWKPVGIWVSKYGMIILQIYIRKEFLLWLIHSMQQSPYWGAANYSIGQKNARLLWNTEV